jgi:hypothetical protein
MNKQEIRQEALSRAVNGETFSNFPVIIHGFAARGIPEDQIKPRENVFTFNAWKALGRHVRKGEHGVKVATVRELTKRKKDQDTGEDKKETFSIPWSATVFHVSQTDPDTTGGAR